MTACRSVSACCDHPDCRARVSDMSAIWDIKTLGWWVSDDSLPLYGSLAALCPDHAPEEDYPEVMEGDWARIEDRMNALLEDGKPGYDDYEEGYALLEDRCKKYAEKD